MKTTFQKEVMDILGISEKEVSRVPLEQERQFYAIAFGLYEKGDYRGAAQLFTQLVLTDPFSEHYWQGLASSRQMAREYLAAVHAWVWSPFSKRKTHCPISTQRSACSH